MTKKKPVILVFVGYYLPGFKAGGALRSVANIVQQLSQYFEFWIITRDCDVGDRAPYVGIVLNQWVNMGHAKVYYCSPGRYTLMNLRRVIRMVPYDLLYFNSFFDFNFTIKPLILYYLRLLPKKNIVLAPRGEFNTGALGLKKFRKKLYIILTSCAGLHQKILWHASTAYESQTIKNIFKQYKINIHVASDLFNMRMIDNFSKIDTSVADNNVLRIVFLSRIVPIKNLDFALKVLQKVQVPVIFDIYGPIEDLVYWEQCQVYIKELPKHVNVSYFGAVKSDQVLGVFSSYDLFFLPTRGENFGHVIAEALSVGTAVLISDQTPWRNLAEDGVGWDLSLFSDTEFVCRIEYFFSLSNMEKVMLRERIKIRSGSLVINLHDVELNKQLFLSSIY